MNAECASTNAPSATPRSGAAWWQEALRAATDLVFPPQCVFCNAECDSRLGEPLLCPACDTQFAIGDRQTCPRCALACAASDAARGDCGGCRGRRFQFAAARSLGPHHGPLRRAVLLGKHAQHEPLARALGQRLVDGLRQQPFAEPPDLVVPVPMHWLKRVWRGVNPAAVLAQAVARALRLPLAEQALVCRRYLRRQSTLTPPQRRENVRGAYRKSWRGSVAGRRVLLVDDVMTTGATAHEASKALRHAGALSVYVAVLSRSAPDDSPPLPSPP